MREESGRKFWQPSETLEAIGNAEAARTSANRPPQRHLCASTRNALAKIIGMNSAPYPEQDRGGMPSARYLEASTASSHGAGTEATKRRTVFPPSRAVRLRQKLVDGPQNMTLRPRSYGGVSLTGAVFDST